MLAALYRYMLRSPVKVCAFVRTRESLKAFRQSSVCRTGMKEGKRTRNACRCTTCAHARYAPSTQPAAINAIPLPRTQTTLRQSTGNSARRNILLCPIRTSYRDDCVFLSLATNVAGGAAKPVAPLLALACGNFATYASRAMTRKCSAEAGPVQQQMSKMCTRVMRLRAPVCSTSSRK